MYSCPSILHCCADNKSRGDYGLPPGQSAFIINAVLTNHFISKGAYYPRGGPSKIPSSFVHIIEAAGGHALVRAPVSEILLNEAGTAVVGVRVRGHDIYASSVISDAGVVNTFTRLIPIKKSTYADRVDQFLRTRGRDISTAKASDQLSSPSRTLSLSCSMFSVYIGLDGSSDELKLPSHNLWLYSNWDHDVNWAAYEASVLGENAHPTLSMQSLPCLFIASPSAKDSDFQRRHPSKSVFELLTVTDYSRWLALDTSRGGKPMHRGEAYEREKKGLQDRLVAIFSETYPHLANKIAYVTSGTPLSNNFYLGSSEGEVYGLSHDTTRFSSKFNWLLRPHQQGIKGLYLTGQDIVCDGICGALAGGVICAIVINPMVLLDLVISYIVDYL
jgi:all-trans-retinol 13,14-reductase